MKRVLNKTADMFFLCRSFAVKTIDNVIVNDYDCKAYFNKLSHDDYPWMQGLNEDMFYVTFMHHQQNKDMFTFNQVCDFSIRVTKDEFENLFKELSETKYFNSEERSM